MGRSFASTACLFFFVVLFMAVTIALHIIAFVTSYWLKSDSNIQADFLNIGHFTACFHQYYHMHEKAPKMYNGCHDLYSGEYATIRPWLIPSWLVAAKIMCIVALVLQILSAILVLILILWVFCKWATCARDDDCCERVVYYCAPIFFILSGIMMMSVVMIWADNAFKLQCKDFWVGQPNTNHLSWSWGLEIAATIGAFITGGFLIWVVAQRAREEI